ncbi:hypothetical protein JET76_01550 [Pseudomonas putida]|uniref:hypothetical protein n=1 Tax=Pseudomonas putida TaxID=303 RepID=UPI000DB8C627|nr:hypothetical protein [Pseudomonas putida]MBI6940019.1 hypothetical protein [Pseudomonas putida]MBI6956011.1 hypothetical protein [Pseudomonas putida]PZQ34891.1 MAG: hypothetical protein DI560_27065 [Pseudomonas putida]
MTEQSTKEFYSVDQASQHAAEWCKRNPAWRRICDIPDISVFEKTYDEIPKRERAYWEKNGEEECWREFGAGGTKVPTGFISGKGEFFDHVLKVPLHHNMMMVYRVGKRWKP